MCPVTKRVRGAAKVGKKKIIAPNASLHSFVPELHRAGQPGCRELLCSLSADGSSDPKTYLSTPPFPARSRPTVYVQAHEVFTAILQDVSRR